MQQCIEPTGTNRPRAWIESKRRARYGVLGVPSKLTGLSGGDSGGVPPVPFPNTEVKPASADGTWGAIPWESRTPPGIKCERAGL